MKKYFSLFLISFFVLFSFNFVLAQTCSVDNTGGNSGSGDNTCTSLSNPLCPAGSPNCVNAQSLIGRIITAIMGVVGSIALLMFVYGGLTWMTSSGSQEKVKKGRDIILWSSVGLVVVFMAYALTKFVITTIAQ